MNDRFRQFPYGHWRASSWDALVVAASRQAEAGQPRTGDVSAWTVYHGGALGSADSTLSRRSTRQEAWTSPELSGQLYGEPLVFSSDVYVATESDTVYALSATTEGGLVTPPRPAVPSSLLPCGNIVPMVGVTGTPVIDLLATRSSSSRTNWRGTAAAPAGGLDTVTGALELSRDVDPPGADPAALLQRTGLTLDHGRVVFAMGATTGLRDVPAGRLGPRPVRA